MSDEKLDQVGPVDPAAQTSEIVDDEASPADEKLLGIRERDCYYNGKKYSQGAILCADGEKLRCSFGRWMRKGKC